MVLTFHEGSPYTALNGSLDVNDLSEEDRGRRLEIDGVVANLIEGRIPSNGLPITFVNASQEDIGNEQEVVDQGTVKEREYDFQPEGVRKRKELLLAKKLLLFDIEAEQSFDN